MSHETILADLGNLIKRRVTEFDPSAHIQHIMSESDRAFIILHSAAIEDFLLAHLEAVMPDLNSVELARLFNFEGPAGSFSSRIRLAQGMGLVSRQSRKVLERIKAMRNVAAHAHGPLDFDTPEIRVAVASFFRPQNRDEIASWPKEDVREIFGVFCTLFLRVIGANAAVNTTGLYEAMQRRRAERPTSPEKSEE